MTLWPITNRVGRGPHFEFTLKKILVTFHLNEELHKNAKQLATAQHGLL